MSDNNGSVLAVLLDDADLLAEKLGDEWPAVREELVRLTSLVYADDDPQNPEAELNTFLNMLARSPAADITTRLIARAESEDARIVMALRDAEHELQYQLGDRWPLVRSDLSRLLVCLDAHDKSTNLGVELNALLDVLLKSSAAETTRRLINIALQPPVPRGQGPAQRMAEASLVVPVYFGTDRALRRSTDPRHRYSNDRGELSFGVAEVSIPASHKVGELEGPKWWKAAFRDDASRYVLLLDASQREQNAFETELSAALSSADESDLLLFVHGYNSSFADAVRRTAQIAYDLKFPGRALLYSWPSAAAPTAYAADEATVEYSIPRFERFLHLALTRVGARTMHVIAHSMGNRALARLLKDFDPTTLPRGSATLRQIVFAAPDIDAGTFRGLASNFRAGADRCTLYASRGDLPLRLSRILHRYPRAGDTGKGLVIVRGVDTIDASQADSSLFGLGHSYFAAKRSILSDIHNLIVKNEPPQSRFDLISMNHTDGPYWLYRS